MQGDRAGAAEAASAPVLDITGARATIRLNRPKHLNRLQADDLECRSGGLLLGVISTFRDRAETVAGAEGAAGAGQHQNPDR